MVKRMRISKYEGCGNSFLIVKFENDINYKFVTQRFCLKYEADGLIVFKMDPVEMFIFNKPEISVPLRFQRSSVAPEAVSLPAATRNIAPLLP